MDNVVDMLRDGFDIPPELQASVQRHQAHLAMLVGSLRAAGVDAEMIETSVRQLVDSYRVELTSAIRAIVGNDEDA